MELTHEFTVPASVEDTWAALNDIESVAGCFPGATVSSADADSFQGSVKVKLGPIALVYNGSGTFVEKDESAHRMVIEAKGKDKRGNGTAGAHVTATMSSAGDATTVQVQTDLSITGKPAQFGRGVMQDVSDKLLGQFTTCLAQKVGQQQPDAEAPEPVAPQAAQPVAQQSPVGEAAEPASSPAAPPPPPAQTPDDALDLGATVLPVLLKTYWREALIGVLGVLLLERVLRRR